MIQELDTIILVKDYPDQGLVKGDVDTVVLVHGGGKAFKVEFVTLTGDALAVLAVKVDATQTISTKMVA
jgi:hypothetical protein